MPQTWKKRFNQIVGVTYSLKLAVVVILLIAVSLAAGTILESAYDTPTAQYFVYRALWFHLILTLLGVNIFAVAMSRLPWKPKHTPFLLAHLGILLLLFGSWLTDHFGLDGNLRIAEGETSSTVEVDSPIMVISDSKNRAQIFPMPWQPPSVEFRPMSIQAEGLPFELTVDQFLSHAEPQVNFLPNKTPDPVSRPDRGPPAAVRIKLTGGPMRVSQEYWLWNGNPSWSGVQAGPAWLSFGSETHKPEELRKGGPNLILSPTSDGGLAYRAYSTSGERVEGRMPAGKITGQVVNPGWKGMTLTFAEWVPNATLLTTYKAPRTLYGESAPASAIHVKAGGGGEGAEIWLGLGERAVMHAGGRDVEVSYLRKRFVLPFAVHLERFAVDRYEGSVSPSSYSSQVTVLDSSGSPDGKLSTPRPVTISMNEPLQNQGITLYQASYEDGVPRPVVSILSVNRDPGRPWKYAGSLLIVFGAISLFAVKYKRKKVSSDKSHNEVLRA